MQEKYETKQLRKDQFKTLFPQIIENTSDCRWHNTTWASGVSF